MPKFSKVLCSASQLFFKKLRLSWAETLRVLPTEKQQSPNRPYMAIWALLLFGAAQNKIKNPGKQPGLIIKDLVLKKDCA